MDNTKHSSGNCLAVVFLVGIATQHAALPLLGQTPAISKDGSGKVQSPGKGGGSDSPPAASIVKPDQTNKNSEYSVRLTNIPVVTIADKNKTILDHIFDWGPWVFSFLLVIVGGWAVRIASKQANLMNKQADLMERQAVITEASFNQWVTLTNWKISKPQGKNLRVDVDLINRTNFPMIVNGELKIENLDIPGDHLHRTGQNLFLAPEQPITISLTIPITEAQEAAANLALLVTGKYSHSHKISKREIFQTVEGRLDCWKILSNERRCHFTWFPSSMNPKEQEAKG